MPAVPKRQRRQQPTDRLADLSEDLLADLRTGSPIFERYETIDDMRDAWEEFGDEILAAWIVLQPGTRPFAWWLFDHGKERPIIGDLPDFALVCQRRDARFGFLDTSIWLCPGYLQEPECPYLERMGILSEEELKRIQIETYPSQYCCGVPRRKRPNDPQ
ncbi:MAG: hypothetical protein JWP89_2680 [Schlesneria sp.]|nr:hypothetical protein [Schlesneria sp.]